MAATTTSSNYSTSNSIISRIMAAISNMMGNNHSNDEAGYYQNEAYERQKIERKAQEHIDRIKASIYV